MPAHDETPELLNPPAATAIGRQLARACEELERRLRAGRPCGAADLLAEFPELAQDKDAVLELIYTDFVLREERGERVSDESWYARFPQWETDLRALFQVDAHVRGAIECGGTLASPPSTGTVSDPHSSVVTLRRVGDYELLGELGRGAMGVVYRARQVTLNREVAFKTILRGDVSPASVARFWVEAEVMAAVRHPNVVQVFELGEYDGQPFMAMELVAGGSMADRLAAAGPLPAREAGGLLEKIAQGVAAAHELGVVHRDLKPANILLEGGRDGGTIADACASTLPAAATLTPKVSDFGLAKWRSADLTRTLALMGTPAYMAPEQAAGGAKFVGPQADVWSLGVVLYECVSGKLPFEGDTAEILLSQIRSAEPVALRTRVRGVPRDLETIVAKCLTKEPEGRYPTAAELAEDLGRFARGEPIAARPVGPVERLVRWVRRKPTAAAAYGLSALAVLLAVVVFVIAGLWREAESAKDTAQAARGLIGELLATETRLRGELVVANGKLTDALKGEEEAKQDVERERAKIARYEYGRTVQLAYRMWKDNRVEEGRQRLAEIRPEFRGWEYDYVHRLCHADLVTFKGHPRWVTSAAFSPDGSKVVTADNDIGLIWDAATGKQLHKFAWGYNSFGSVSFSPDGTRVLTAGDADTALVWDAATGKRLLELRGNTGWVNFAAFSPDGSRVVTGSDRGTALVWDATTGKRLLELKGHTNRLGSAFFSPDGSKVVTAGDDTARVWDARTGKQLLELKGHAGWVGFAAFSPDGSRVVTASGDGTARIWDAANGKQLLELKGHPATPLPVSFSPDGSKVLTASFYEPARIWDAKTGKQLLELKGHTRPLRFGAFSPDGSRVVTTSDDATARVWDSATGKQLLELKGHIGHVYCAAFSPDGSKLVTGGMDNTARIWDATGRKELLEVEGASARGVVAAFSPDGSKVFTTGMDRSARVRDTSGKQLLELKGHNGLTSGAFSPDGSKLITGGGDGTARIWDAANGRQLLELKGHTGHVHSARYNPAGSKVVTAGWEDKTALVWDAATGKRLLELKGHDGRVNFGAFSPDGSKLVTASDDRTVRVWDATTGRQLLELEPRTRHVLFAAFSPDGSKLVAGWEDKTALVWDAATGKRLIELKGHNGLVNCAAFSPDGSKLVTTSDDRTARVWDATTGRQLLELKGHIGHVLSAAFNKDGSRVITAGHDMDNTGNHGTLRVWDTESGAELLTLPGASFAAFSPDGGRIITAAFLSRTIVFYDSRPVNRVFIPLPVAPAPRAIGR